MKILITGSEGLLRQLAVEALRVEHEIIEIDIKANPHINLLNYEESFPYFKNVETVIHFAAYPKPWISSSEAKENIDVTTI